ncbi:hypothetical protein LINPERPRIM_LOCUS20830, partial [Linum perenne]
TLKVYRKEREGETLPVQDQDRRIRSLSCTLLEDHRCSSSVHRPLSITISTDSSLETSKWGKSLIHSYITRRG